MVAHSRAKPSSVALEAYNGAGILARQFFGARETSLDCIEPWVQLRWIALHFWTESFRP